MSTLFTALLEWIGAIVNTICFFQIVDAWEKGVVLRLGKPVRDVGPGLRFHIPFHIERILTESCAWETVDLPVQSVCTKDGIEIAISAILTYRVKDVRKFLIDVGGEDSVLSDSSRGVIRKTVGQRTWDELQQDDVDAAITKAVRERAWRWGVEVSEAKLSDLTTATCYRIMGGSVLPLAEEEE